jgi:hypothetical protein
MKIVCIGAGYVGVSSLSSELLVMAEDIHLYSHMNVSSIIWSLLHIPY